MQYNDAYKKLEVHFGQIGRLRAAETILQWDMETMMPHGAAVDRGEQLWAMRNTVHRLERDERVGLWISEAEAGAGQLGAWQQANLREMHRVWAHARAMPSDLIEALTKAGTACLMAWRRAKESDNFHEVAPHLEKVLDLVRAKAFAKADTLKLTPYDALLDEFEPGGRVAQINPVFERLSLELPPIIEQVLQKQSQTPRLPFSAAVDIKVQRQLMRELVTALGFSQDHGRLDESAHPFCGGTADDVRITTRYNPQDALSALMAVIHETGHALYERGLPLDWRYQPVGIARGMVLHESQSLLFEMQLGRSRGGMQWLAALGNESGALNWRADALYQSCIWVKRSLIRVEADEVTYPMHIMLRYRLELALLSGDLKVADLPIAWNEAMQKTLHVKPPGDREGCLQDIHWMDGSFGYFPTYTLGAIVAAELGAQLRATYPDLEQRLAQGQFETVVSWLRENLHSWASFYPSSTNLLEKVTGQPLNERAFLEHLKLRYLGEG